MGHNHGHHHHNVSNGIGIAFLLNFGFTIIEFFGGYWTNSMSIISDAVHDAGDSLALGLAWYLQKFSERQPTAKFTYGYKRLSTLGALVTAIVLIVGISFVLTQAIGRLYHPQPVIANGMILLALLGIAVNGVAFWKLSSGDNSLNSNMAKWHLLEDALGWIAVLIGATVITFTDWYILDPILSLLISLFILWNVFKSLRPVASVFFQVAPDGFDVQKFETEVTELPEIESIHQTHTWSLDGESHVFSTHLVMQSGSTREQIVGAKEHAKYLLIEQHFDHITISIELDGERCDGDLDHDH